jgi:hypothetical protein
MDVREVVVASLVFAVNGLEEGGVEFREAGFREAYEVV